MDNAAFRTTRTTRSGGLLPTLVRLAAMLAAGIAVLAMLFIGFFLVLPLMLAGGTAFYFYLRRRMRQARRRAPDDVIEAEYTIIEHR